MMFAPMRNGADRDPLAVVASLASWPSEVAELFDHIEDVLLWAKDADGHYHWVNLPFALNFGFRSRTELLGRTDFDICSLPLANQYRLDDERVLAGERVMARIELVGRFDHTARWCATSKTPLRDSSGAITGTAGVTYPLPRKPPFSESPLSRAISYINENYAASITHEDLAAACSVSVRVLERQFMAAYRLSPHDYIRQLRVRMSCHALVFSQKPLAQVATDFGFADQSHFTKEFRRLMGETPHTYRVRFR